MDYVDYMLLLSPPEHINRQVQQFKKASHRLIGDYEGMHSRAHISLTTLPRQRPLWVQPKFATLEKELTLIEPFTLQVNNFNHFLPTDFTTIYAAILSTPEMEDWFKRLRKCLGEKKSVPHITIARQVPNALAKILWPKFKSRAWNEAFTVDRLTILERPTYGYDKSWKKHRELPFRGDPLLNRLVPKQQVKPDTPKDENQISLF